MSNALPKKFPVNKKARMWLEVEEGRERKGEEGREGEERGGRKGGGDTIFAVGNASIVEVKVAANGVILAIHLWEHEGKRR